MTTQATANSNTKFATVTIPDDITNQGLECSKTALDQYHQYLLKTSGSLTTYFSSPAFQELILVAKDLKIEQFAMLNATQTLVPAIQITSVHTANVTHSTDKFKHNLYDCVYKTLKEASPEELEAKIKTVKDVIEKTLQAFALQVREKREQLQRISGNETNQN
jgi:hypothetical protein